MIREAIYHRAKDNYAYAYDEQTVHIRLRTKKEDVSVVNLIYGDPWDRWDHHNGWGYQKKEMIITGSDQLFDYWFIAIQPPYRRLRYGFELLNDEARLVYTENGFFDYIPCFEITDYFCFPFLNKNDVFCAPSWVKNTVWYQIFPERFANGDESRNPPNVLPWASTEPTADNYFGGDFEGVIQHIDHLVELGVNGIYFTPIFHAASNHKYDTINYFEIDPQFGDKQTFKRLVETCHARGIKVMLDAVFNHSGFYFPPFQDVLKNGEKSTFVNWFHTHGFPLQFEPKPNFDTFGFVPTMPKLNTENIELKNYLLEVGCYWIREFDIDGWRLDVANEVDHQFWRDFRKAVKEIKADVFIIGEVWHDSMPWLQGDQFDAVMNYPFTNNVIKYFATNEIGAAEFRNGIYQILHSYPSNINEVAFNILDSHDTPRILTTCGGNKEKVKLLYVFLLSFTGSPCIYYGDEIGMIGENDPGCRHCMIWDKEKQDNDLFQHLRRLISLRKEYSAFRTNDITFLEVGSDTNHIIYSKKADNIEFIFILNTSNNVNELVIPFNDYGKQITDIWLNEQVNAENEPLTVTFSPYGFKIYMLQ